MITIKGIIDEDFTNYKQASMVVLFPTCSFKCGKENCQNTHLLNEQNIEVNPTTIMRRFLNNPITSALIASGLDPLDSYNDLLSLVTDFRKETSVPIVIYTGHTEQEVSQKFKELYGFKNIVIKFGRYLPGYQSHYDDTLGVYLPSDNQYAKQYNWG